ncbi:hypothetical protein BKA70DRAFT_1523259 [Coprinopsis sp. MPI-PUGE-AT-0042]|nr:hypothetical protein BKA70DRAFT_1523259 [Coprinopsis sp. MPI-PUGE-AT-0042]
MPPKPYGTLHPQQSRAGSSDRHPPFDRVPLEIWAIIFGFVLGGEPFGRKERKAFICLRSVCIAWRKASATPGLLTGLDILLDDWVARWESWADSDAEKRVAPWLAFIGLTQPYHLLMRSEGGYSEEIRDELIRYLLTITPSPTSLSIDGDSIFPTVLASAKNHDRVLCLKVENLEAINECDGLPFLEKVFPNLQSFVVDAAFDLDTPVQAYDLAMGFSRRIPTFSLVFAISLRTQNWHYHPRDLPAIEVLAISSEILAVETLSHLTIPSLKFFGLEAFGTIPPEGVDFHTYLDFFSRSGLTDFTVSITGDPSKSFLGPLVRNLPPCTLLHLNVESLFEIDNDDVFEPGPARKIFCPNLQWLEEWWELKRRDDLVEIFVPFQSDSAWEETQLQRKDLGDLGYIVEACSTQSMENNLKSRVPWMSIDWALWS